MKCAGVAMHYELQGCGASRVVLLHGWGCSGALMKSVADALSPDMTVLSIDFPAHGGSGRPPEPWGVPDFAEALRELLIRLDFLPCAVVAHSFGVRVSIYLASTYPEMFTKLVFTGGAGIKPQPTEESKKRAARYQQWKKINIAIKKVKLFEPLARRMEEALREKYGSADYNALDEEMRKTFVKVVNLDLSDRLREIQQPTLLLWGDRDTATPLWMGQQMEKDILDAGLVVLEGGTHFAYVEQPARFNAITHHFLTQN